MSTQIRFFATADDLVPVLKSIESKNQIKYVKFGRSDTPAVESFLTVTALPTLGRASNESSINCDSFLIRKYALGIPIVLAGKTNIQSLFRPRNGLLSGWRLCVHGRE